MSAEILRLAAAKMRERAEVATPGPWEQFAGYVGRGDVFSEDRHDAADCWGRKENAEHIASWHPAVALAVADWLELVAETPAYRAFAEGRSESHVGKSVRAALAVAVAYLGADA